jgi:hypothetical protein
MTLNGPPLLGKCSGAEQLAEANAFEAAPIGDGTAVGGDMRFKHPAHRPLRRASQAASAGALTLGS